MSEMLSAVAIIFIVAGPFLLVANRYNIPAAPLLIVAGLIAGQFIVEERVIELAQFGIALLVFTFGVGIQLSSIRTVLADSELAAIGQILVLGSLGTGFGVIVGVPIEEAIYLGVAAALSSTIVGTALLQTEIRRELLHGRLAQSIQFVEDIVAVGFILIIGAGVFEPGAFAVDPIATEVGYGVFLLVAALVVNRYLFDLMRRLAGESDELMIIGVVSLLVVFIGAATAADVSIVVGAFAAGLAVKYDPARSLGLFNGLESIKDFFVAVFFVTVGALIVLPFIETGTAESVTKLVLVAGLVLLTIVVKPIVTSLILISRGYEPRTAVVTALSTDQVSEFALIIAIEALILNQLTDVVFDAIILAAALTMIISAVTHRYSGDIYQLLVHNRYREKVYRRLTANRYGEKIYQRVGDSWLLSGGHDKIEEYSYVPEDLGDHVVIVGYGRKGKRMVETCEKLEYPYVVIENDPARLDELRINCDAYIFGNALGNYTWEKAKVEEARVIVSMADAPAVSRRVLEFDFDAPHILRAQNEQEAIELLDDGAMYVSVPDLLAAEQLASRLGALLHGELSIEELRSEGIAEMESGLRLVK